VLLGYAAPARADGLISPFLRFTFRGDTSNCVSIPSCEEWRDEAVGASRRGVAK